MSRIEKYISRTISEKVEQKQTSSISDANYAFSELCYHHTICGYFKAKAENRITTTWIEEDISASLSSLIETCFLNNNFPVSVFVEIKDQTELVDGIKVKAKKLKKYDFYFRYMSFTKPIERVNFTAEAKVLVETNKGTRNARSLNKAYISETGMKKYIDSIYKEDGFMIGYVIEGNPDNIVSNLNNQIHSHPQYSATETIKEKHSINGYDYCYNSKHPKFPLLKHLLLDFSRENLPVANIDEHNLLELN